MAKPARPKPPLKPTPDPLSGWRPFALLAILTLIFYWVPLTSSLTTPHWDAIDVHYSSQKYFADHVLAGDLPFWTPYLFSGFPFLADPQVGAWYPPNWPFFLAGITPKALEAEVALHSFLAAAGMFLLLCRLTPSRVAALIGSLLFAFNGFFADHTSHIGLFCAASWLPWLALFLLRAIDGPVLRWTLAGGLAAGAMILAGHFQGALYTFFALALFAIAQILLKRSPLRILIYIAGTLIVGALLSAIMTLPGLELTSQSLRAATNYGDTHDRILLLSALANLVWPNATGYFSQTSTESNYYLYGGILLLPLAALGLRDFRARILGLTIAIPAVWYMLGPSFGLYRIGAILPFLHRVRAPIHAWFVAAFALAILATIGLAWLADRQKKPALAWIILAVVFADLFYFNSYGNPSTYQRASFEESYGSLLENTREQVTKQLPPGTRFDAPNMLAALGPLNHPLDLHIETTYGYNPLELTYYSEYRKAAGSNPKLVGPMNVSRVLDTKKGVIVPVDAPVTFAYFARGMEVVPDSQARLATLDPAALTLVSAPASIDPEATVLSITPSEQQFRIRYRATRPALLRIAVPFYPGWRATVANRDLPGVALPILRADHAFQAVEVPPGENELQLTFHSAYFTAGALISAITLLAASLALWRTSHKTSREPLA